MPPLTIHWVEYSITYVWHFDEIYSADVTAYYHELAVFAGINFCEFSQIFSAISQK